MVPHLFHLVLSFYRPSTDSIQLPPREAFIGTATSTPAEAYYSTLLHKLTHFTSHETRCNRQLGKRFGDADLLDASLDKANYKPGGVAWPPHSRPPPTTCTLLRP